jgi:PAS domain S-box-containing protein
MQVLLAGSLTQTRSILHDILRSRGHDVILAETAEDAASAVASRPPDMVVLVPSGDDSIALCRRLRDMEADPLVVFVCEERSLDHIHVVFDAGADDCILLSDATERLSARFRFAEQAATDASMRLRALTPGTQAYQQAAVASIGRRALAGTERAVLMAYAARVVAAALQVSHSKVLRYLSEEETFLLKAGVGWNDGCVGQHRIDARIASQARYTMEAAEPVVVENIDDETRFDPPPLLADHDVRSGISVVIASSPEPYGILGAHDTAQHAFDRDDVYFMQSVANVLAGAVERDRTERALRETEAKARSILDTTVDGIITIDDRGHIESFNAAAEDIFGYAAAEVIGKNVKVLMPSPYQEEHDGYMRSYHETGRRRIIGIGREVTGQRKDGSTFPMDLAVSEVKVGDRHLFTGIVRDISERRKMEKEILEISEKERRRIGQDLHDGLGQMLTGIGLLCQNLTQQLRQDDHPRADDAAEITSIVKEADQYARDLARGLTPVDLEASGLSQALQRLADNAVRLFGVECKFEEVGTALVHNSTAATHLYRIAQEAVSNAVRHGQAEHIKLVLASGEKQIRLRIHDDGHGFESGDVDGPGKGVHIMNYRARIIGGTLEISSDIGEGTVVTCTLPHTAYAPEMKGAEAPPGHGTTGYGTSSHETPSHEASGDGAAGNSAPHGTHP